jgi:hypothetical protein
MLAGTPGVELGFPPKLIEVTDAGVPLICAGARGTEVRSVVIPTTSTSPAAMAEFSRFTFKSYSRFATIALLSLEKRCPLIRTFPALVGYVFFLSTDACLGKVYGRNG